jgi:IS5 family transposase
MRPKQHETRGSGDLFRARLDQIINMRHEPVQLAGKIDWDFIDGEIAPVYSDSGRPGIATRFVIGLFLLKHIYGLSDEGVCERWVYDPYFQHFTGEEFFQHEFPHERSDLSHWRKRLGAMLELPLAESLRVAHESGALRTKHPAQDRWPSGPGGALRRRSAIEAVIGHMKAEGHLGRCSKVAPAMPPTPSSAPSVTTSAS